MEDSYFFGNDIHFFVPYRIFLIIFYVSGKTEIYNTTTKTSKFFNTFKDCYDAKVVENKLYIMVKGKFYVYKIEEKITQSNAALNDTIDTTKTDTTNTNTTNTNTTNTDTIATINNVTKTDTVVSNVNSIDLRLQNESAIQIDKRFWIFEIKNEKVLFANKNRIELYHYNKVPIQNTSDEKENTTNIVAHYTNFDEQKVNKAKNSTQNMNYILSSYKILESHKNEIFEIFLQKNKVYSISEDKIIVWSIFDNKIHKQNVIKLEYAANSAFLYDSKIFVSSNDRICVYNVNNGNLLINKKMKNKRITNYENKMYSCIENRLEIHEIEKIDNNINEGDADEKFIDDGNKRYKVECDKWFKKTYEYSFDDTILFISVSSAFYGVSLLNNKIILFDRKTNDQKLILYGHSLPVSYFTFSYDNKQVLSCGSDKLIKLWGTDFGECRKSFVGNCKNAEFITDNSFVFADKEIKYMYKNKVVREYKGFDQRIVKYNKKYMVIATKYGIKIYKVGEYEMIVSDKKISKTYTHDDEFESSSEINNFLEKETQTVNYKKFEYFMNELEKSEINYFEILKCMKNLDFGEIEKFVYFLNELQIRNILKVVNKFYSDFAVLMGRLLDYIIKIHSYLCEYDSEIHETYKKVKNEIEKVRNEMGCNLYLLDF